MFKTYQNKPTTRKAHLITGEEKNMTMVGDDYPCQHDVEIDGGLVSFNASEPVNIGDYIIKLSDDDIYHCNAKVFNAGYSELNFVDIGDDEETFVPESAVDQITALARCAHGVLMQYSLAYGQQLKPWDEICEKEQKHIIGRIAHFMTYPEAEASAPHEAWRMRILLSGWSLGPKLSAERKTRPDLCYFSQLPPEQQACDFIIKGLVHETFHN